MRRVIVEMPYAGDIETALTDEQVELARMAIEDHPDQPARLLHKDFGLSLTQAICAVAYAKKHPRG